jgi:hypothetical protein
MGRKTVALVRRGGQSWRMTAPGIDRQTSGNEQPGVDLYWIPLGAGAHVVRWTGSVYERWCAHRQGRSRRQIYHSALLVRSRGEEVVIEQAPAARHGERRGVLVVGPVATPLMAFWPLPRYEVRCWTGGRIDDLDEALDPVPVGADDGISSRVLSAAHRVPNLTWGRDAAGVGEMWNSNSVIAWILQSSGVAAAALSPPAGGVAPGWATGWIRASVARPTDRSGSGR